VQGKSCLDTDYDNEASTEHCEVRFVGRSDRHILLL
jgi:hypothetical protein